MDRKIKFSVGEYYHIYNRGVEKRNIFIEHKDRIRFLKMLRMTNGTKPVTFRLIQGVPLNKVDVGERLVAIGAYVLMPNHFHVLVKETRDGGITNFMEKLTTGYAMYFNKKHERVGSLFQGRFKAEHVNSDRYLKYLFAYIHLNPVKLCEPDWKENGLRDVKNVENFLGSYYYSSYPDYSGECREEKTILSLHEFPKYFNNKYKFLDFHKEWLNFKNNSYTRDALV